MDYELIFWLVAGVASLIACGILHLLAKREAENYVEWVVE